MNWVKLAGSIASINKAPVVGSKTVGTTAAEIFAGAQRLAGREYMEVCNIGTLPVYWGPASVTVNTGMPIQPGDSQAFGVEQTPVYFVASANNEVRIREA
ncbi:hypothetical protein Sgly_0359 [Syntrophobotulus glycolicus DSM 8271]|uniref:Uncharacterized protein n=1 Tax=Syntrophobotulus glycolicus (strain DSM 8271 / FlGlyR) TaxID=645991 RepID=F0SXH9_SYNGF|nr:hypothetical protein [Syntrophobotulus glycolicus]ADY54725.1 hypothetical protein Sgly_0359 [Syntrophobotulus glycolicus DSM 8271]